MILYKSMLQATAHPEIFVMRTAGSQTLLETYRFVLVNEVAQQLIFIKKELRMFSELDDVRIMLRYIAANPAILPNEVTSYRIPA